MGDEELMMEPAAAAADPSVDDQEHDDEQGWLELALDRLDETVALCTQVAEGLEQASESVAGMGESLDLFGTRVEELADLFKRIRALTE